MTKEKTVLSGKEWFDSIFGKESEASTEHVTVEKLKSFSGIENIQTDIQEETEWDKVETLTFDYKGIKYAVETVTTFSDNDTQIMWDTFQELDGRDDKIVMLLIHHENVDNVSYSELFDAQEMYENMLRDHTEKTAVEVNGVRYLTVEIKEFIGNIPVEFLNMFPHRFTSTEEEELIEWVSVKPV